MDTSFDEIDYIDLFSDSSDDEDNGESFTVVNPQQDSQSQESSLDHDYYQSMLASHRRLLATAVFDDTLVEGNLRLEKFRCLIPTPGNRSGVVKKTQGFYTRYHVSATNYGTFTGSKPVKFIGHRLSLAIKLQTPYYQMVGDTSHLCHSKEGCIRSEHLHLESHLANMRRNDCSGFHYYKDSKQLLCFCLHEPKCLFVRIFDNAAGVQYRL